MAAAAAATEGLEAALDAAALELLEALETLQQRRHLLSQLLRQGWLSLSQARYSLGCHRVSSLQYGATMVPRVRILPRQDPGGALQFEEVPGTGGTPRTPTTPSGGEATGCGSAGVPQKEGVPPPGPPDPLAWFGVLVPPSLRQAQGSFIQGVTVAVELAGLQDAVAAATTRYRDLLRRKRHLDGDTGSLGDIETLGDIKILRDIKALRDTGSFGDIETMGDTKSHGDIKTTGDTGNPGDTESHGDTEVVGDTGILGDTKTMGDTKTLGDTKTMGDTETTGDMGTSGDTW